HPGAIAYAALVLGVADPAASQVGKRVQGVEWPVIGCHKTLAGSLTFAAVTVGIGLAMSFATGDLRILSVLGAAAVLALVEGSLSPNPTGRRGTEAAPIDRSCPQVECRAAA